ncbi:MAG: phage antirepressor N-terminal domain-containing protein [Bacteroidota bacterium]
MRRRPLLEFNGKDIPYVVVEDTTFIAIRPICDALGVDYHRQYKNIKKDKILNGVLSKQPTRDSESRMRNYIMLPEKYVYGWLFKINSNIPALHEYKKKCYDILYNHFHGELTKRNDLLRKKAIAESEIQKIEKELKDSSEKYQRLNQLKGEVLRVGKEMKKNDNSVIKKQLSLFN